MLDTTNIEGVRAQANIVSPLRFHTVLSVAQREPKCPICGVTTPPYRVNGARDDTMDQAFGRQASMYLPGSENSASASQNEGGTIRRLFTITVKTMYLTFVAVGAGIFTLVLLSVYGGLPFLFA